MYKKTLIPLLALAISASHTAAAQSLIETYDQALANDPTLAVARLNAESSQQDLTTGYANVLPTVTASSSLTVASDEEGFAPNMKRQIFGASVGVTQNIFALAALTAYDAVKVNASITEIQAEYAEQELMVRVAESYINALIAKDALEVLNAQLEAVDRQYQQTQQRYDVGLVTITDVLDASATLDQTKVSLIRAESSYDIALQNISTITGEIPDSVLSISEDLPIVTPSEDGQQQWIDYAINKHPEIIAAERGLDVGRLTLKAQKENLLPTVAGILSFDYDDVMGNEGLDNDNETNWSASATISISMDLYNGGANKAGLVQQGITNNIAEQNVELLKRAKSVTVANLYRTVRADAQNIEAQKQVLKSSQSALQATTVGYDVGTRNIVEVLNSQLTVFSAQNDLNNARYSYLLDLLNLKKEAGQLTLADLQSIEDNLVSD